MARVSPKYKEKIVTNK